jgi:large subunit ribosomal protein L13
MSKSSGKRLKTTSRAPNVIDADGLILGRLASGIAKRLLQGEEITVVNAEKAILSGKKTSKVLEAKKFLEVGHVRMGPFHYRRPDRIVRKTVRGMLPHRQPKGKQAFRRLRVFIGVPDQLRQAEKEMIAEAQSKKLTCPYFTVGDFARELGWSHGE